MKNNNKKIIQTLINNFNAKNYELVIYKTKNYLKKYSRTIIFYNLLGSSYQNIGKQNEAITVFNNALKIDPKNIYILNNLGNSYKYLLNYVKAEKIFSSIIQFNPKYINAYINLGNLKRDLNKFEEAIKLYTQADKIYPNNYIILYLLALAHQGIGDFAAAIDFAKKTLNLNPKFTKADYLISQTINYDSHNNWHFKELVKKFNSKNLNNEEKINVMYSLAKANEDLQNIEESFKFLKKGSSLYQTINNYNLDEDKKIFENIKKVFKNLDINSFDRNNGNRIIFVLGMPRSGTSLMEQIISAHDEVMGGGEMPIIPFLIKKYFFKEGLINENIFLDDKELFIKKQNFLDEYDDYINHFDIGKKFIIDKSPLNFIWIGFIKILLPNSKIIHCSREPKNNCLSLYKNLFENTLKFTYDENSLAGYYKMYQNLMEFWEHEKKIDLININYETLISNSEIEIKKIIKSCGLEWSEKCLYHYKNKNPIKTMSTTQARKPFYKTSLDSFEKYRNYLTIIEKHFKKKAPN